MDDTQKALILASKAAYEKALGGKSITTECAPAADYDKYGGVFYYGEDYHRAHPTVTKTAAFELGSLCAAHMPTEEPLIAPPGSVSRLASRAIPRQAGCTPVLLGAATVRLTSAFRRVVPG